MLRSKSYLVWRFLALALPLPALLSCAGGGLGPADFARLPANDVARQTLPAEDGWGGGTTGGAAARADDIYTVTTRKQFIDALKRSGSSPKIIRVQGTINLSSDDAGRELVEKDYADPGYDFEAYKKAYDPNKWNRQNTVGGRPPKVSGPLEEARRRSYENQKRVVQVLIPSNTTIIGIGSDAKIIKGNLYLNFDVENIIIRNIAFEDAFDYFPMWNPEDTFSFAPVQGFALSGCQADFIDDTRGPHRCNGGRWNGEYDLISVKGATRVWIDHCSFSDGARPDKLFPSPFAFPYNQPEQKFQHHDGSLDITNGSNYVTVSHNHFSNHDKLMLVGGSDNYPSDEGKLKVTIRHNFFDGIRQRQPLTRYGQVHVYNNLFRGKRDGTGSGFSYAFGLGRQAKLYSQNNAFEIEGATVPDLVYHVTPDSALFDQGSLFNGQPADIVNAFNARNSGAKLSSDPGWKPAGAYKLLPAAEVAGFVLANQGPGKL
ncbi:PbsX family transcriptional regulator [Viridibacterium curvum]|uniref:Pectate lyase n=1 Tax=Viridibacterium curvum TaxID=1101404 RepID=A0ABP9QVH1_9RHOO